MHYISFKSAILLTISLYRLAMGKEFADPEAAKGGIRIYPVESLHTNASSETDGILGDSQRLRVLQKLSWQRSSRTATLVRARYNSPDYWEAGFLEQDRKYKIRVVALCAGEFKERNIFWKGPSIAPHIHQDNKNNQQQFVGGVTQATADLENDRYLITGKPMEIMTERKNSACGAVNYRWKDNGNWGKLGDVMDFWISYWVAPKETCAMGLSSAGGNGLQCSLPCDPIHPMWLEKTDWYGRMDDDSESTRFAPLYKMRRRFNRGDGNGGLGPETWLHAQCNGDDLTTLEYSGIPGLLETFVFFY
ncbi:hypothetical protein V8C42DRAFT_329197 [Trichoderma barbatum]